MLDTILSHFECVTGTVHVLDGSGMLELLAQRGIPDSIIDKVSRIPVGKGMAGLAAERRKPVQVCNLQTDESGDVRPGAKDTAMAGSVAAPIFDTSGELVGTLGVAKPVAYDFSDEEMELLESLGRSIAAGL
ncbi:MAG: GAF domain-containing protein [Verrucomicrobiales bacterium]